MQANKAIFRKYKLCREKWFRRSQEWSAFASEYMYVLRYKKFLRNHYDDLNDFDKHAFKDSLIDLILYRFHREGYVWCQLQQQTGERNRQKGF